MLLVKKTDLFGRDAEFEHIGIAVRSIKDFDPEIEAVFDVVQGVRLGFADVNGLKVELIEPASDASPVKKTLEKGQTYYHVCFKVKDLEKAVSAGMSNSFHLIKPPVGAVAFGGKKIAWLFSKKLGLVELLEA